MREVLAVIVGYLLGSVLPADLMGRARGVDLRAVGTCNPGTTNALGQLGLGPGLVTGAYDASVGLASMYVASRLGLSPGWVYVAGLAAIVGHVFPVYFGFHGGQGMAAATGMLLYGISVALSREWLMIWGLLPLGALALGVLALTRSASVVAAVALPVLGLELAVAGVEWRFGAFMAVLLGFIWAVQVGIVVHDGLFHVSGPVRDRLARLKVSGR